MDFKQNISLFHSLRIQHRGRIQHPPPSITEIDPRATGRSGGGVSRGGGGGEWEVGKQIDDVVTRELGESNDKYMYTQADDA